MRHVWSLVAIVVTSLTASPQSGAAEYDAQFARGLEALSAGRLDEGIAAFQRCLELAPRTGTCAYNLACGHARKGEVDSGIEWLERALEWGYADAQHAAEDSDLARLREDPRFAVALDRMRASARAERERAVLELEQRMRDRLADEARRAQRPTMDWLGGHSGAVFRALFSPDGERVMTISLDRTARIWDARTGDTLLLLQLPDTALEARFAPDGERVLTVDRRSFARLWDARSGELLALLGDERFVVTEAEFSPDGERIATGSSKGTLQLWDVHTGAAALELAGHPGKITGLAFSPDGSRLASSCANGSACLWDVGSGERRAEFAATGELSGICFAPGGEELLVWGPDALRLLESDTCAVRAEFVIPEGKLNRAAISPDGRLLLAETSIGLLLLDMRPGEALGQGLEYEGWERACFHPDGSLFGSSSGGSFSVFDVRSGDGRWTVEAEPEDFLYGLQFAPDGERILTASSGGTARLWDVRTGAPLLTLGGHPVNVQGVTFSPDGERIASLGENGCQEWSTRTGESLAPAGVLRRVQEDEVSEGAPASKTSPLGENFAWQPSTGIALVELHGELRTHAKGTRNLVRFSRDGEYVATRHFDVRGPEVVAGFRVWEVASGELWASYENQDRIDEVLDFSPQGLMAVGSSTFRTLHDDRSGGVSGVALLESTFGLWRIDPLKELASLGPASPKGAARFSPDGKRLACSDVAGAARILDVASRRELATLSGHAKEVLGFAFDAAGERVATAGADGAVRVWRVESGEPLAVLRAGDCEVSGVAFAPDGRRLAGACSDGTARLWNAADGELLATFVPQRDGGGLCFSPSLHYVASASAARRAHLVVGGASHSLELFASTLAKATEVQAALSGHPRAAQAVYPPPSLEILAPAQAETVSDERTFRVQAVAVDRVIGVERIDVTRDGSALSPEALAPAARREPGERTLRLDLRVDLAPGTNETTLVLQAVNARGTRSLPQEIRLRHEPAQRDLYVLAIGVSDYDDDELDLECPVKDARDLTSQFEAQQGALFARVHVERLEDAEVSVASVRRARESFLRRAQPEDTIVVFVAGHGVRTDAGEYYFLTRDASADDPYSGIDRETLESLVTWDKLYAARRVLLIDTCHSGTAYGEGKRGDVRGEGAYSQSEVDERVDDSSGGLYILAASSDRGFAREQEGNGLFTRALLDGLAGAADADGDRYVTIEELKLFASREVHEKSGGRQRPTIPAVVGGEDFRIGRVAPAKRD